MIRNGDLATRSRDLSAREVRVARNARERKYCRRKERARCPQLADDTSLNSNEVVAAGRIETDGKKSETKYKNASQGGNYL